MNTTELLDDIGLKKKFSGPYRIWTMTSAITGQRSTNWANYVIMLGPNKPSHHNDNYDNDNHDNDPVGLLAQ